jgi:hypothetical protein
VIDGETRHDASGQTGWTKQGFAALMRKEGFERFEEAIDANVSP